VKSTEFYKVLNSVITDKFSDAGFERVESATSFWHLKLGRKHLFYKICVSIKSNYDPILGGDFLIRVNLLPKNAPDQVGFDKGFISYMQYYSEQDLEEMKQIRDAIVRKILGQTEFESEFDRQMFNLFELPFKHELGKPFRRDFVLGLQYRDCEDIAAWGDFLAKNIGKTVKGIQNKPVFFHD
jgi:hypothetical protein